MGDEATGAGVTMFLIGIVLFAFFLGRSCDEHQLKEDVKKYGRVKVGEYMLAPELEPKRKGDDE